VRNLGLNLFFCLAAIVLPTNSLALGLGDIEVESYLNQPLKAEIKVISARPGEVDDLLVGLASRDAFTRAGLSRPNNLTEIRFSVKKSEDGESAVILVTTRGSIKEPFLNFLVEADWSKGRLLREFTILLDPPFYADTPAPAPAPQPATQTAAITPEPEAPTPIAESSNNTSTTNSANQQQTVTEPIAFSENDQQSAAEPAYNTGTGTGQSEMIPGNITVEKGDTLWGIASKLRGATGYSMNQVMLAIQRVNPGAFGDENVNNLKVGAVLRLPDASTFGDLDRQQAYAQVLVQNGLWDDYVARVSGNVAVAGESNGSGAGSSNSTAQSGELNLVTPGDGNSDAAGLLSEGSDANELRVKLALAEEELDASKVENVDLKSRIADLEARLSKFEELQKMLEIEDNSLAQLQSNQTSEAEKVVNTDAIIEEQKAADEGALLDELLPKDAKAGLETDTMPDEKSDTAAVEADTLTENGAASNDNLVEEQPNEAPPVPVIVTEIDNKGPSLLDGIVPAGILKTLSDILPSMDTLALDPLMLGGLGGILLLIIGLVIYKRKKTDGDDGVLTDDEVNAFGDDEEDFTPIHLAEGTFEGLEDDLDSGTDETDIPLASLQEVDDDDEDEFSRTAVISKEEMPEPEEAPVAAVDEQDDILNEADVYLAYNLYENAEDLLKQSIEANPERADYRSKLLDTYFATKNIDAFVTEAENLKSMGKPADNYWDRVMVMGYELSPDNALFAAAKDSDLSAADLEIAKPEVADFDLGAQEDDTNFSTTDFDLGEEDTNTLESTDFNSGDIDVDLDLDELPELSDEDDTNIPAFSVAEKAAEEEAPDENADLDFSFDGDGDDSEESVEETEAGSIDFDLPDDLDLGSDLDNTSDNELDFESTAIVEADTGVIDPVSLDADDDDSFDLDLGDDDESTSVIEAGTGVIDTAKIDALGYESESFEIDEDLDVDEEDELEATAIFSASDIAEPTGEIDFGMDDTAMMQVDPVEDDDIDDLMLDLGEDADDDGLVMDVDIGADDSRTGTFAPGDFDDPEELDVDEADFDAAGFDDIEDLMLPDDVDEVSTKLDLARAFIDMGDAEGARSSLDEVMEEGNDEQKAEAKSLLDQM